MDALVQYLLPLFLFPLSLGLIHLFRKSLSAIQNLPPGTPGWPLLGENLQFASLGPQRFVTDRMKKYSQEVFQTSLFGGRMAVLCGPEGNKFIFKNEGKLVTLWWPKSVKKILMFPDEKPLDEMTALMHDFLPDVLKPEALKHYIPLMDSMAREHIDRDWTPHSEVKAFPLVKEYTFGLACCLFMDVTDPHHIKKLADQFQIVTTGLFSVPVDFPGTAYNAAIKAGRELREQLLTIIRERKKELVEDKETAGRDVLSRMFLVRDEHGQFLCEKEISNNIVGLLVASYETTSSAITFVLKHIAEFPHIYNEVFKEQMEIAKTKGPNGLLTWEDIQKMKYSWNVARESLRFIPPGQGGISESQRDFTYAGFTIPKGWKTFWTVHSTYQNPDYFPEPQKFDPSRFEGRGPAPYTYLPFGGGPRMCPGKEYARLELLVFVHNVIRRFKLEKLIPNEKVILQTSPVPAKGFPVRLQPHGE